MSNHIETTTCHLMLTNLIFENVKTSVILVFKICGFRSYFKLILNLSFVRTQQVEIDTRQLHTPLLWYHIFVTLPEDTGLLY